MSLSTLMKDSVKVYVNTFTTDADSGAPTPSETMVDASFPCNVQPMSETLMVTYNQRETNAELVMYHMDRNLTFTADHEIEIDSTRYEVTGRKNTVYLNRLFLVFLRRKID